MSYNPTHMSGIGGGGGMGGGGNIGNMPLPSASLSSIPSSSAMSTMTAAVVSGVGVDPTALLHQQLISALSTTGDAQYWEETISPNQIRIDLEKVNDPINTNHSHIQQQIRCMKWLLANISKGRDVSDFYPYIIKLVSASSLEVRKMVYMFTVQYANYNNETREISLLSINAFQRGLVDNEPLIRGLALRVLTSLYIIDIIQIQILAVQTCCVDTSPYVRKCAANAIAKLVPRISDTITKTLLMNIIQNILDKENSTMVLTSALTSFSELTISNQQYRNNNNINSDSSSSSSDDDDDDDDDNHKHKHMNNINDPLELCRLHHSYRKICHLLTDMDEWGQVIVIELLTRYCRTFFQKPINILQGTAERIDRDRRVRRPYVMIMDDDNIDTFQSMIIIPNKKQNISDNVATTTTTASATTSNMITLPPREHHNKNNNGGRKIKRRVVRKGFYSDEEDESTEEEVAVKTNAMNHLTIIPNNIIDNNNPNGGDENNVNSNNNIIMEDSELASDHRLLLQSAMPLLKSRNAGVVLAVCTLQYYCGVASIPVRSAIGKALVRVVHTSKQDNNHRGREIQYIILSAIQQLVSVCPSAFTPYMNDFFIITNQDPHFTRLIKLDILIQLALEPSSINAILNEIRSYIRLPMDINLSINNITHNNTNNNNPYDYDYEDDDNAFNDLHDDIQFACMSIRAVGRIAEMTKIVYERHHATTNTNSNKTNNHNDRVESNRILLNCLYGLIGITESSERLPPILIGETIIVMRQILILLHSPIMIVASTTNISNDNNIESFEMIHDPNHIQERAFRRILLFLIYTLNSLHTRIDISKNDNDDDDDDDDDDITYDPTSYISRLEQICGGTILPARATAAAISYVGEIIAPSFPINANNTTTSSTAAQHYQNVFGKMFSSTTTTTSSSSNNPKAQYRLEIVRLLSRSFIDLTSREKEQAIHYASRLIVSNKDSTISSSSSQFFSPQEIPLCEHILSMGRVDVNSDIRDRARYESNLIHISIGLQYDKENIESNNISMNGSTISNDLLPKMETSNGVVENVLSINNNNMVLSLQDMKQIFLQNKPPSSSLPFLSDHHNHHHESSNTDGEKVGREGNNEFRFGTLSSLVGHRARSSYLPLPPWASQNSLDSLREPPPEKATITDTTTTDISATAMKSSTNTDSNLATPTNDFYKSSSSSNTENSSDSESSSESDSDAESVSPDSKSSDSSSSSSDTDDDDDESKHKQPPKTNTGATTIDIFSTLTRDPQPRQESNILIETESGSISNGLLFDNKKAKSQKETLLPGVSYAGNDMQGLVWPTATGKPELGDSSSSSSSISNEVGVWIQLIRPEHSGGLSVQARYLKGTIKSQQSLAMGLTAEKPTVVCVQLLFENVKTDTKTSSIRHIRFLQRSWSGSNSSSVIGPRKVVVPPEIQQLGPGEKIEHYLGIDFTNPSDREGSLVAKFDVKIGTGGGIPIEIKPVLGDLLLPCHRTISEFDKAVGRMHGFQRLESNFMINSSIDQMRSELPKHLSMCGAFTGVPSSNNTSTAIDWNDDNQIQMAGTLPASMEPVYIVIKCIPTDQQGKIIVCCDNALAVNTIMTLLKRVASQTK